jgi:hypothetical protein
VRLRALTPEATHKAATRRPQETRCAVLQIATARSSLRPVHKEDPRPTVQHVVGNVATACLSNQPNKGCKGWSGRESIYPVYFQTWLEYSRVIFYAKDTKINEKIKKIILHALAMS